MPIPYRVRLLFFAESGKLQEPKQELWRQSKHKMHVSLESWERITPIRMLDDVTSPQGYCVKAFRIVLFIPGQTGYWLVHGCVVATCKMAVVLMSMSRWSRQGYGTQKKKDSTYRTYVQHMLPVVPVTHIDRGPLGHSTGTLSFWARLLA